MGSLETGQVPTEGYVVRGGNLVVRSRCTCRRLLRSFQTGSHRYKSHMEKDRDEIISFDRLRRFSIGKRSKLTVMVNPPAAAV